MNNEPAESEGARIVHLRMIRAYLGIILITLLAIAGLLVGATFGEWSFNIELPDRL